MKNILTENGLSGNSGFVYPNLHLTANYAAGKDKVFVERNSRAWGLVWERMTLTRAKKLNKKIITCSHKKCKRPAISVDHHWPYMSDMNYCEKHKPK